MERCTNCRHKRIVIQCMSCKKMYCTSCIQIELHACEQKNEKIKKQLEEISLKNQKITSKKI